MDTDRMMKAVKKLLQKSSNKLRNLKILRIFKILYRFSNALQKFTRITKKFLLHDNG